MTTVFSKIILNLSNFNRMMFKIIKKKPAYMQIVFNDFHRRHSWQGIEESSTQGSSSEQSSLILLRHLRYLSSLI